MNMNNEIHTGLKEYQAMVDTSATALLTVRANSAEEARQILARAFGTDDSFTTDMALRRMQGSRRMLGLVSHENTRDELEVVIGNAIWIRGVKDDKSMDNHETTFLLRENDEYDPDPEELSMGDFCDGEDYEAEGHCLLYLLNRPAERIPMDVFAECACELGNQLAHKHIPDTDLFLTYNPCSILDVDNVQYLIAPALAHGITASGFTPLTDEEYTGIEHFLTARTVTLTADGEEFHALKLWD